MLASSAEQLPTLPPGTEKGSGNNILTISLQRITLFQGMGTRPTILKLSVWGSQTLYSLGKNNSITFSVRVTTQQFAAYLNDMKVMPVFIEDLRNGERIGKAAINWALYLNSKPQNMDLPFYQNSFLIQSLAYNSRNKKVAQLHLSITFAPNPNPPSFVPYVEQLGIQNLLENNNLSQWKRKSQVQNNFPQNIKNSYKVQQNSIDFGLGSLGKPRGNEGKKKVEGVEELINFGERTIRYSDTRYELEKIQLKLEAEQFLKSSPESLKPQTTLSPQKSQRTITILVSDLVLLKSVKMGEYIDLYIHNKKDINDYNKKEQNLAKKHVRIFKTDKDKGGFQGEISMGIEDTLTIELANSIAKGSIEAKIFNDKKLTKLYLTNKSSKISTITLQKLHDTHQPTSTPPSPSLSQPNPLPSSLPSSPPSSPLSPPALLAPAPPSLYTLIYTPYWYHPLHPLTTLQPSCPCPPLTPTNPTTIFPLQTINFPITLTLIENGHNVGQVEVTLGQGAMEGIREKGIEGGGLSCLTLGDLWVKGDKGEVVHVVLWVGTLQQVNYTLIGVIGRMSQGGVEKRVGTRISQGFEDKNLNYGKSDHYGPSEQFGNYEKSQKYKKYEHYEQSEGSSNNTSKIGNQGKGKKYNEWNRKIYTEQPLESKHDPIYNKIRTTTQPLQQPRQLIQQNSLQTLFLVQILSNFLHQIPRDSLPQTPPKSIQQFQSILESALHGKGEKEFVEIVVDMFVDGDQGGQGSQRSQRSQKGKIDYQEFIKCHKGYHNFLELFNKIRAQIATKVTIPHPDYTHKAKKYEQLGLLSRFVLWNKIFTQVSKQDQINFQKLFNIPSDHTFVCSQFLQQLSLALEGKTPGCSPGVIVGLGKIVKETVQSILEGSGGGVPKGEDKINIRGMCTIMQQLGIGVSYWQALILIEELKTFYGLDHDCNQGIISSSLVQGWLNAISNRTFSQKDVQEQLEIKEVNIAQKQSKPLQAELEAPQQAIEQKSARLLQNKSIAKSDLNQDEISSIANLLRANDGFAFPMNEQPNMDQNFKQSEKNKNQVIYEQPLRSSMIPSNRGNTERQFEPMPSIPLKNNGGSMANSLVSKRTGGGSIPMTEVHRILNDGDTLGDISSREEEEDKDAIIAGQIGIDVIEAKKAKFLWGKVKMVKIKMNFKGYKVCFSVNEGLSQGFYCKNKEECQNKQFVLELQNNWERKSQGLHIRFYPLIQNFHEDNENCVMFGVLLSDQICQLTENPKNKTIILYNGKDIMGKMCLQISMKSQKPKIQFEEKKVPIWLQIHPQSKKEKQWDTFEVQTANFLTPELERYPIKTTVKAHQKTQIYLSQFFYKHVLIVQFPSIAQSIIPLEQLYFRRALQGDYPLVATDGKFVAMVHLAITTQQGGEGREGEEGGNQDVKERGFMQNIQGKSLQSQKESRENGDQYLVVFEKVCSFWFENSSSSTSVLGNLICKSTQNKTIYKSPYPIDHHHNKDSPLSITPLQQYTLLQKSMECSFEIQYNGATVGVGKSVVHVGQGGRGNDGFYEIEVDAGKKMGFWLVFTVVRVPKEVTSYSNQNLFKFICKNLANLQTAPTENLTQSELKTLKRLSKTNNLLPCAPCPKVSPSTLQNLMNELKSHCCEGLIDARVFEEVVQGIAPNLLQVIQTLTHTRSQIKIIQFLCKLQQKQEEKNKGQGGGEEGEGDDSG